MELTVSKAVSGLTSFVLSQTRTAPTAPSNNADVGSSSVPYNIWTWGGKLHQLPKDFELPSVDIATAWRLWHLGNVSEKILPYRKINTDDLDCRRKRNIYYDWKYILKILSDTYERKSGKHVVDIKDEIQCRAAFDIAQSALECVMGPTDTNRTRRSAQLKIATITKIMRQHNREYDIL